MRIKAFKLQNIWMISFKIGFLFPVPADLALICWLKIETFLNDLTYDKPSSPVVPAYPQLFCNSVPDIDNIIFYAFQQVLLLCT